MSPDDEDTAAEVSEHSTGQAAGPETSDAGASQEFSDIDVAGFTDSMEEAMGMYGPSAIGKGMSQNQFNAATGRTNYNPHPNSFWSQLVGAENVDYTAQYGGPQGVAQINAIALDVYNNPIDSKGNVRGADGQATAFGTVKSIDRQMAVPEMVARGLMSLTPLGLPTSMLGRTEKSIAPIGTPGAPGATGTGYNYNATLDPASPSYAGSTGMFSGIVDALTGGAGTQAYDAAKTAVQDVFNSKEKEQEREDKGSGQFGVSDDRSFDAFGNVRGSALDTKDNFGINSLDLDKSKEANMQVADASQFNFLRSATNKVKPQINKFLQDNVNKNLQFENDYRPDPYDPNKMMPYMGFKLTI